jgi:DNA repair exonuclease SbcCD nuclease subunit
MKVLFTADLHIKLGQKNVPIEWAKKRYNSLFKQICNLAAKEDIELMVLGGDIFDRVPTLDELELYFDFMFRIRCDTVIYSGNHEATKRNETFLSNLKDITYQISCSAMAGHRIHIIDDFKSMYGIDFIPYNKLKEFEKHGYTPTSSILCTHCRGEIPPHVKPEINLGLFKPWKLVLAGDLHSYENSQGNILYPGSPITTSFHRSRVDTGVIILDTDTLVHRWIQLDLPQLIRKTIKAGEDMIPGDIDHVIYEVEGDLAELAGIDNNDLIDKKVIKRESDSALILDPTMTILEEVEEYLRYIQNLKEEQVASALKELQNYV